LAGFSGNAGGGGDKEDEDFFFPRTGRTRE
jgi:hypothetical protein